MLLGNTVKEVLDQILEMAHIDVPTLAKRVNVSVRTLQRVSQGEKTSFQLEMQLIRFYCLLHFEKNKLELLNSDKLARGSKAKLSKKCEFIGNE